MDIHLPEPIEIYFASEDARDADSTERCFASDAVVRDEGRTIEGMGAIKAWRRETAEKYHHTAEPLGLAERDGKVVVAARVSGDFPGSPVTLDHVFELDGDRIVSLEIH